MTGKELDMEHQQGWFVGIDWGSQDHQVHVSDAAGVRLGARSFPHDGAGLAAMAEWILTVTGARPGEVAVAIETPHGPGVESLVAAGIRRSGERRVGKGGVRTCRCLWSPEP